MCIQVLTCRKLFSPIVLVLAWVSPVLSTDPVPASDEERRGVLKLLEDSERYKELLATRREGVPKSALIFVKKYVLPKQGDASLVGFVTMHYNYETAHTTQAVVNLQEKKVLEVEDLGTDYPTPLGPEEFNRALALAKEKVPQVAALYRGGAKVTVEPLTPQIVNPQHPLYRKRATNLFFHPEDERRPSLKVTVSLLDGTATLADRPRVDQPEKR
jgi:hypothetical protein